MKEGMQLTVTNVTGYELNKNRTSLHDGRGPLDASPDHLEPNLTDVAWRPWVTVIEYVEMFVVVPSYIFHICSLI